MAFKIILDGRQIKVFGYENQIPDGEGVTTVEATYEEFQVFQGKLNAIVSAKGIPCWVDGDIVAALPDDPEYDSIKAAKKIATEELRISLGIKTKAYMGYLCEVNNLTLENYQSMLGDNTLAILDRLLLNGALESAKTVLDAYTPTEYFVEGFKTALSAKLAEHIATVNAFIAE